MNLYEWMRKDNDAMLVRQNCPTANYAKLADQIAAEGLLFFYSCDARQFFGLYRCAGVSVNYRPKS